MARTGPPDASDGDSQTALGAASTVLALSLLNPHVYLDTVVLLAASARAMGGHATHGSRRARCVRRSVWFTALGYGARLLQALVREGCRMAGAG